MTVLDWLLDADPALRWQVLRDLTDASPAEVAEERARVAVEGWGARLLAARDQDGQWAGGACFPGDFRGDFQGDFSSGQPWTSTLPTLTLLRELGVDPSAEPVREAVRLVAANCRWEYQGRAFFAGEVEPCINGRTVAIGAYFGVDVSGILARLIGEQLADGGWNCAAENGSVRSSFHSTICVLEGLLAHEPTPESVAARNRGEEYLLARGLFRRLSTGEVVDPAWLKFAFPTWWHYDVLRALDYFRATGADPDPRIADAVELVRSTQLPDGTWPLDHVHRGAVHFALDEGVDRPSRWNTLRALRVLAWYDA